MLACKRGHEEVVRVLLTAGAELHQKDSRGRTAKDTASKRSHETILAMLHPSKQMRLMQVRHMQVAHNKKQNGIIRNFTKGGFELRFDLAAPHGKLAERRDAQSYRQETKNCAA